LFDDNLDDDDGTTVDPTDPTYTGIATDDDPASQLTPTDEEISTDSAQFTIDQDMFPQTDDSAAAGTGGVDSSDSSHVAAGSDQPATPGPESDATTVDPEAAAQQAHADAAKDAQDAADQFVSHGDYAAAAQARETAENEAYAAGDNSMLGSSSSG